MSKHFLRYWISRDGDWSVLHQKYMEYSASDQYDRVDFGDVIWAVVRDKSNKHLILIGRMTVDWIGSKVEASRKLQMAQEDMYDAKLYVTCKNPETYDYIDLNGIAHQIRFISNTNDRLNLDDDGLVSPQQLQAMRELHPETIILLNDIWYGHSSIPIKEPVENGEEAFTEGRKQLRIHYQRERNAGAIAAAKQAFLKQHGRLFCEVCGFDFSAVYGELGDGFIEAHHRKPISQIEEDVTQTTIEDLAMVCANCHRMLHRKKPWLTIEELKEQI